MSRFAIFRMISQYIDLKKFRWTIDFSKHFFGGLWKRIDSNHLFLAGAGISYSLLISMIPFILLIFSILGSVYDINQLSLIFKNIIDTVIPYPEFAKYVHERIVAKLHLLVEYKTSAGYIGSFGLLFTSTWLFSSMRTVLNTIFGVSEEKSAWMGLLRDFGMVILLILFVTAMVIVLPLLDFISRAAEFFPILKQFSFVDNFLLEALSYILIYGMFYVFYYLIPYEKIGKVIPAISSFWATVFWGIMKTVFGYYVNNFLMINKTYGPFLVIVGIAFWIFYASVLFILGAEIGQLYREWQEKKKNVDLECSERLKKARLNNSVVIQIKEPDNSSVGES